MTKIFIPWAFRVWLKAKINKIRNSVDYKEYASYYENIIYSLQEAIQKSKQDKIHEKDLLKVEDLPF